MEEEERKVRIKGRRGRERGGRHGLGEKVLAY